MFKKQDVSYSSGHPLLNHVVLKTLCPFIHSSDLPSFRLTCRCWASYISPRYKEQFPIDLTAPCCLTSTRKTNRFIYSTTKTENIENSELPFDSFKISELRLAVISIDKEFLSNYVPHMRKIHLDLRKSTTANNQNSTRACQDFWWFLFHLDNAENLSELILEFSPHNKITKESEKHRNHFTKDFKLKKLTKISWICEQDKEDDDEDEEELDQELFSEEFLKIFYGNLGSCGLKGLSLNCGKESWKHFAALGDMMVNINSLYISTLTHKDLEVLAQLPIGFNLGEFSCNNFSSEAKSQNFSQFLKRHANTLSDLTIGGKRLKATRELIDPGNHFEINLPTKTLNNLKTLNIFMNNYSKIKYQPVKNTNGLKNLRELNIFWENSERTSMFYDSVYFLEDFLPSLKIMHLPMERVDSLSTLCLVGLPLRYGEDTMLALYQLFPNVKNLTLGRPSKQMLVTLWSIWPRLNELKIISACPQIDEVITGLPSSICRRLLIDRHFDEDFSILYENEQNYIDNPSMRNLKYLHHFSINEKLSTKLQTLSCLPSDISIHYALKLMPELRNIRIYRSLVSPEAISTLRMNNELLMKVKIGEIKFHFDESIPAFKFHENNQRLLKLLCRYPSSQSLRELPAFFTSLWVQGRLI